MLDREIYLRNLKSQFRDDIKMVLNQCEDKKRSTFDYHLLTDKLSSLQTYAVGSGISENEWMEMLYDLAPVVYDRLYCTKMAA